MVKDVIEVQATKIVRDEAGIPHVHLLTSLLILGQFLSEPFSSRKFKVKH